MLLSLSVPLAREQGHHCALATAWVAVCAPAAVSASATRLSPALPADHRARLPSSVQRPRLMQRGRLHLRHWLWRRRLLGRPPRLPAQLRRPRNVLAGLMRGVRPRIWRTRLLGGTRERLPGELQRACAGCSLGRCECDPGFGGAACDKSVPSPGCPAACSGRGSCHAGACLCLRAASAAQAASLRRRSPRAHPTVRGAARVSTACAGATRDGPGARATASSRSRVHLTGAARLRARPTASAS